MNPKMDETIVVDFITYDIDGNIVDADDPSIVVPPNLPLACAVYEDQGNTPIHSPVPAKRDKPGSYFVVIACTLGNGFDPGKSYNVQAEGTIGGYYTRSVVHTFQIQTPPVMWLDLTQPLLDTKALTVGGALAGSWAVAWGKTIKDVATKVLSVFGPYKSFPAATIPTEKFTLDDPLNPTIRTPQNIP